MTIDNKPTEFELTPNNLLDTLMEWLPGQLDAMRLYQKGPVILGDDFSSLQLQYMQTVGGEKFRIVDVLYRQGDSGSVYYPAILKDEDIIMAFAERAEKALNFIKKTNSLLGKDRPIALKMKFSPGRFDHILDKDESTDARIDREIMSDIRQDIEEGFSTL